MTNKVLLISESQLKETSTVELTVDSKTISKVIWDVQQINLKPILQDKYNAVLTAVYNASTNHDYVMSDDDKTLINDYIQPYLINAVIRDFLIVNNYKISNKGALKLNDSNATSIASSELEYIKDYYDNRMASYKSMLIDYLQSKDLVNEKSDANITTEIGWYLGNSCRCKRY